MSEQDSEVSTTEDTTDVSGTAIAEEGPASPFKMSLVVDIQPTGPCKKHVKVQVPRADIDHFYEDSVKELITSAAVPGFRTGHVPRQLVVKRFRKEVGNQVRQKVLMQSLQQLGEDHKLDAINEPDLDVESLILPENGDFTYEFDVEVRPEFDLPNYSGLTIKRPMRAITDEEVQAYLEKYLAQFGQLIPQDGPAVAGNFILADLRVVSGDQELSRFSDQKIRIAKKLRFADVEIADFDKLMVGVRPGDHRDATSTISVEASAVELRGEPVTFHFDVNDVQQLRLPELNQEFLDQLEVDSEATLRQEIRQVLERQVTYEQRQATRVQVLEQITASADWDLPESMVTRQVDNALRRETFEMQQAGFTDEQVRARQNQMLQSQISSTRQALKEHFVLDKIATEEKLEVTPQDKDIEIAYMAMQRGESPRRLRARLEKMGLIENLEAQILERKAVDVVLAKAVFVDVPGEAENKEDVEALELSVCGKDTAATTGAVETTAE